ncbi:MAG: hypothetical protein KatS3mg068_0005 [Candidatus Sericytochromatia bacterium]|nr:MAG: hypothetical protein KatS3mg068_0005 [Candidatus Sericytochromatia bacterium]
MASVGNNNLFVNENVNKVSKSRLDLLNKTENKLQNDKNDTLLVVNKISKKAIPNTIFIDSKKSSIEDIKKFEYLYNHLANNFEDRVTNNDVSNLLSILLIDNIRSVANDQQKVKLLVRATQKLDSVSDKSIKDNLLKGIDNIIEDFKKDNKMDKLIQFLFLEMSNTGVIISRVDDWGARKFSQNDKLLNATNPSQKANLIYQLKFGYTSDKDQEAILRILDNAVKNNQLKNLMASWSDGLDFTASSLDAMYSDISSERRVKFLEIIDKGMKNEKILPEVMKELYGANTILNDLEKLKIAKNLESQGKYKEASVIYSSLSDYSKTKELLEKQGNKDLNSKNYLSLFSNFIDYSKVKFKENVSKSIDLLALPKSSNAFISTSSHLSDKIDSLLKDFPLLQSKNIMEIQEKRDSQLKKLEKIEVKKLTPQEKIQNKILLDKKIDELTGTRSVDGNRIKLLLDGKEAFERIKERINNAKESIYIDVYLFYDDPKGHEIADMLIKKANEGLDVRVIIDGPGNLAHGKIISKLKNSKVQFYKYRGSYHDPITNRGQVGNHRKLYIFDKKTAMTGGINLGEKYLKEGKWHDLLVEVEGPIMSDTLKDFYKKWSFTTGKPLEWTPPPTAYKKFDDKNLNEGNFNFDSTAKLRLITTSPSEKRKDIRTWMLEAIKNAKERVYIQDPYFNDPDIIKELKNAINRGVKVQIILPNANDVHIMKHIGDYVADELYAEGADVYIYNTSGKESFNHLKATIVDDLISVGSANKDMRAMNTNEEINYVIDDKKFTEIFIKRVWENDIKNSTQYRPVPDNVLKRLIKQTFKEIPSMF